MEKLLNKRDIENIIGEELPFYTNASLSYINNVNDLFKNGDKILLLYIPPNSNVGHWVGLKKVKNQILYFDSFGRLPDAPLDEIGGNIKADLSRILYGTKLGLQYSDKKLQHDFANTCGRWVALFFLYCTDIDKFSNIFYNLKNDIDLDKLVYYLTE